MPLIDDGLKAELLGLYAQPSRHYHNMSHIEALLALAQRLHSELTDPEAVEAAIWFHDAIYDSRASDNEARSARLAAERLAGKADAGRLATIDMMIRATATHIVPQDGDPLMRRDIALFLDMDLSILGAGPAEFDAYERAVREEYRWVSDEAWRGGRAAVLRRFLDRAHIFHTGIFRSDFESRARANIARSLAGLAG